MKYKLYLRIQGGSGEEGGAAISFYKKASAILAAEQWVADLGAPCYLWDGESWTTYAPIP